ncbi:metal-dependent transcriptional regulator [Schaalia sp. 19OD2882]|uniref:metal-dependent transcriptional regulator n=1 Tax=Schaalia sp. 19OD2882 TaxID=2794089 RepID=UPI001C1ED4E5|nr:metal-dependent transcriptional regulator [Schaalia sp. 19OD2882]QWW19933.1 metal-dependent transcriptional regulator [Schaalia sp. 19OD2882]
MGDLIDTTEMYLKTVLEMEEDGVTPLRARIVERLGHSGPTVSQTVARMERDGLLHVLGDRRLELTDRGRALATDVMRKHRLAERLLLDVIGLDWAEVHEEACRWEHVMSEQVEERLGKIMSSPTSDPYGNPIPGSDLHVRGRSVEVAVRADGPVRGTLVRIGEPIQAEADIISDFETLGLKPGALVEVEAQGTEVRVTPVAQDGSAGHESAHIPMSLSPHMFVDLQ